MRVGQLVVASVLLLACRSDRAPSASAEKGDPTAAEAAAAAARRLAGCYVINTGSPPPYQLHLAPSGEAYLIGSGPDGNWPGDTWEWSAGTDSTFIVSWSGIDSWMRFTVSRRDGKWVADGTSTTADGEAKLPATVEKIGCPLPGA